MKDFFGRKIEPGQAGILCDIEEPLEGGAVPTFRRCMVSSVQGRLVTVKLEPSNAPYILEDPENELITLGARYEAGYQRGHLEGYEAGFSAGVTKARREVLDECG